MLNLHHFNVPLKHLPPEMISQEKLIIEQRISYLESLIQSHRKLRRIAGLPNLCQTSAPTSVSSTPSPPKKERVKRDTEEIISMNLNKLAKTILYKVIIHADDQDWEYESEDTFLTKNIYKDEVPFTSLLKDKEVKDRPPTPPKRKRGRPRKFKPEENQTTLSFNPETSQIDLNLPKKRGRKPKKEAEELEKQAKYESDKEC